MLKTILICALIIFNFILNFIPNRTVSKENLKDFLPVVTYNLCGFYLSMLLFIIIAVAAPLCLLYYLLKDIKAKNIPEKFRKYLQYLFISLLMMYTFDYFQDYFARHVSAYALVPPVYFKYIIHMLFAPIFFVDIIYNLYVDKMNYEADGNLKPRGWYGYILFLCENGLVLVYIFYAVSIFAFYYKYVYGLGTIEVIVRMFKRYFVFQLLSVAVIVFGLALYAFEYENE